MLRITPFILLLALAAVAGAEDADPAAAPEPVVQEPAPEADAAAPEADVEAVEIGVVDTWAALAEQPPIRLADGSTVRVGIESGRIPLGGGVLVYLMLEGDKFEPRGVDPLGPLQLDVRLANRAMEKMQAQVARQLAGQWAGAQRLLFVGAVHCESDADHELRLLDAQGHAVARRVLTPADPVAHPWYAFRDAQRHDPFGPGQIEGAWVALAPDFTTAAGPDADGDQPVAWQRPGAEPPAEYRALPAYQPPADNPPIKLTAETRRERYRLTLSFPEPITLVEPTNHLLVRWWLNGRPFVAPAVAEQQANARHMRQWHQVDRLTIDLYIDPESFASFSGEKVGVQILWCPDGHKPVTRGDALVQQLVVARQQIDQSSRRPLMSAIAEFHLPHRVAATKP